MIKLLLALFSLLSVNAVVENQVVDFQFTLGPSFFTELSHFMVNFLQQNALTIRMSAMNNDPAHVPFIGDVYPRNITLNAMHVSRIDIVPKKGYMDLTLQHAHFSMRGTLDVKKSTLSRTLNQQQNQRWSLKCVAT